VDRFRDIAPFLVMDALALVGSWIMFYGIRFELGWVETVRNVAPPELWFPAVVVAAYWLLVHAFFGLYRQVYLISRFDELIRVAKTTTIGVLVLFFLLFIDNLGWNSDNLGSAKYVTFIYWVVVFGMVATGRMIVLTAQIQLVRRGRGIHKALIVGTGAAGRYPWRPAEAPVVRHERGRLHRLRCRRSGACGGGACAGSGSGDRPVHP
jgi:FlaA1/EpsC-like NDP-sugar epimerase